MSIETASKVTASHLARTAYLYVRQSTLRQVLNNTESTQRQYALRQRAIATNYRYFSSFGLTYRFGSSVQSVVNPRL